MPTLPPSQYLLQGRAKVGVMQAISACVRLTQSGCRILSANAHGGTPCIEIDRRPNIPELTPGALRADRTGAYYRATLGGVAISWTERRARS